VDKNGDNHVLDWEPLLKPEGGGSGAVALFSVNQCWLDQAASLKLE
jgi:hypothetical protein